MVSTAHGLSEQVHINHKPACFSMDEEMMLPGQEGVITRFLLSQTQPAFTQGRAEGMHTCQLIQLWQNWKATKNSWLHFRNLVLKVSV